MKGRSPLVTFLSCNRNHISMEHLIAVKVEDMDQGEYQGTDSNPLNIEIDPAYVHSVASEEMVQSVASEEMIQGVASEEMVQSVSSEEMVYNVASEEMVYSVASEGMDAGLYCRLCATTGIGSLFGIFSKESEHLNIVEKIGRCLPIIVFPADSLPSQVCACCLEKLNVSYKLVIEALNAEKTLKAMFMSSLWNDYKCIAAAAAHLQLSHMLSDLDEPLGKETVGIKYEENRDPALRIMCEVAIEDDNPSLTREEGSSNNINKQCKEVEDLKSRIPTESKETIVKHKGLKSPLNIYGPVTCDICNKTFTDMNMFDDHVSDEHLMKWQCRLCDDSFKNSADLLAHKVVEHSSELVSCEMCDNAQEDEWDMVEEWLDKPEMHPELQCRLCYKVFPNERKLERHYLVHVSPSAACKDCGDQCRSQYGLVLHTQQKHAKEDWKPCSRSGLSLVLHKKRHCRIKRKLYQCNACDKSFFKENTLKMHSKVHSSMDSQQAHGDGRKKYTCDCGESFEWLEAFQAHKQRHKKPSSMECVTCHKVFTNETFYKRHRYIHDPEYWDRFKCQTCQRPFRDAQALHNHQQLHTGIKPHVCDLCGRTYNRHANMLKHRKLHKPPNQWEHKCNQCEATYERMKDLMAHIECSHNAGGSTAPENDKNSKGSTKLFKWICRFCGKRISTKLSLQDHERIHTGLKPYICEWCGREFRSRPNLLQHHLTHTGDRKHSCGVCGKKFARKSFITQHMRVHTGEKPFECNVCGHRFTQAGDMRRHRRRHADIKMTEFISREAELKTSSDMS
ncbi:zinc finger protein 813 isoform X2 [Anabrus simplex]|uniref:zinc finger protein 813 isoform X2 n=1 Tax=Anabrus simplex TaxID=316456 RepID=UPI0035A33B9F